MQELIRSDVTSFPYSVAPAQSNFQIDSGALADIWKALWRQKGILVFFIFCGLAAGFLPEFVQTPVYRARTSLQLEGFNDNYLNLRDLSPSSPLVANASAEVYLQNQLKILQSETLARRVADSLHLGADTSAAHGISGFLTQLAGELGLPHHRRLSPEEIRTNRVLKGLTVRSSLQSQILEILYDSPDPVLAARIANAAASEYVAMNREARLKSVVDTTEWLVRETADLKVKVEKSGQELQAYARSSGLLFSLNQTQDTLSEQKAQQLQQALLSAQDDRAIKQSRYEAAKSNPNGLPDLVDEPQLRELQQKLATMRADLAQLQALYTPSHYKVLRLNAEIKDLEETTAKRREVLLGRIKSEFDTSVRVEQLFSSNYVQQTRKIQEQMEKTTRYGILKREFETTQQLYDSMLQKVKEAAVASALRTTNIRIIDPARAPALPYSPNLSLNCAIALAGSVLFGVGLIIVREQTDSSLKHAGDSRTLLNLRELGVIPAANPSDSERRHLRLVAGPPGNSSLDLATWQHGPDLMAESFRATTASILFYTTAPNALRVYVFTSAHAKEGKTTVLSNVGVALAETRRRVLLIDADLRRPRLHEIFDIANDRGLTDLLQDPTEAPDKRSLIGFVHHTHIPGVDVLPSGPGVARIAGLLHSPALPLLLSRLREEYDAVLIDTPPVREFSDARILGRVADSVILVVRAGQTRREDIRASWWQFVEDQTPIHGLILNAVDDHNESSRYSYYGTNRSAKARWTRD